ncbi:beta/gamma crystallin domain-containing protein [Amycolatopsis jejuensis]|uniref:beta/gamma crystallin domain-containing protein n=1 Tax=Amycolatopsis jejuensis TaxID=330084 RepID=UPI000525D3EC|nr:beta/gamma crystallin domain-containing protein [Amycolatopsis jejuensis]
MNRKVSGLVTAAVTLGSMLLPASVASANPVPCNNKDFVRVVYHFKSFGQTSYDEACFANGGWNRFTGHASATSWMDRLYTGNNNTAFRDCNGTVLRFAAHTANMFSKARCISEIGIGV